MGLITNGSIRTYLKLSAQAKLRIIAKTLTLSSCLGVTLSIKPEQGSGGNLHYVAEQIIINSFNLTV